MLSVLSYVHDHTHTSFIEKTQQRQAICFAYVHDQHFNTGLNLIWLQMVMSEMVKEDHGNSDENCVSPQRNATTSSIRNQVKTDEIGSEKPNKKIILSGKYLWFKLYNLNITKMMSYTSLNIL
jgi:hypothetical protein